MATTTLASRRADAQLNPIGRLGMAVWRTLTSVKFAVLQISALSVAGVIGAAMKQVPAFALHDPSAYAAQMAQIHATYDATIGTATVDIFERLGLFRIFSAPWFVFMLTLLVVSIIVCTLDRTPDLWRKERLVRIAQAPPFFDLRLENRAVFTGLDETALGAVAPILRRSRFRVREERIADPAGGGIVNVYGDKNQYFRLTTLFTHLGLILFLSAAALTTGFGFETVIFLGQGETAPVQPVGTPDNLLVKNIHFDAPTRPDGSFADFSTDLAVFQNGQQIARKTIRVNDPLELNGYAFHQNTFGPAENMLIRDASGAVVLDSPVLLDGALGGRPEGFVNVPGSAMGLLLVLEKSDDGGAILAVTGLTSAGPASGNPIVFLDGLRLGETSDPGTTAEYSITWAASDAYTGMVIKRDPGQGLVWLAYLSLITGLVLTFYFPRRRFWARFENGKLQVAMLADRYVDAEREFEKLVDAISSRSGLVAERTAAPTSHAQ